MVNHVAIIVLIIHPHTKSRTRFDGFTQSSYPAFDASDEDYKTLVCIRLLFRGAKVRPFPQVCKFFRKKYAILPTRFRESP